MSNIKQTSRITLSAIMASLATALMLLSYFPYFVYAIPALAGLFIMILVIEINIKWATMAYIASAVLVFLLADPESRFLYVFFFGYYPIAKAAIEKMHKPFLEWPIKVVIFNASVISVYLIFSSFFSFSMDEFGELGKYGAYILLALGNVVFVVYDIAVSRMAMFYMAVLHPKVKKIFK